MGLLDDAIREHLELKRRHGADPGEVARLEHEALGPRPSRPGARRGRRARGRRAGAARRSPTTTAASTTTASRDEVPAEERLEAPIHHVEPEPPSPSRAAARRPPAPAPEPPVEVEQPDAPVLARGGRGRRRAAEAPAEPAPPAEARGRRRAEDVVPADDEPEGEDVLEETPGVPAGDARARPALVRAEAAARLRLLVAKRLTWLDVFTSTPLDRQRARRRPRRRRHRRRDDARLRARDEALGDDLRPDARPSRAPTTATASGRSSSELPFAGHPSLGTAVAVAHARGEREARYVQQTTAGLQPVDVELDGAAASRARRCSRSRRSSATRSTPGASSRRSASTPPTRTPSCRRRSSRPAWPT